ncbi:MAG: sigma-70 family RNA polymerase sigma factor [Clostridia bacterium]|nr:sigma-70 family RNA polymerase sigma factor [Clostridia bacterium]
MSSHESLSFEEQLVSKARKGDQVAFVSLLTKYTPVIRLKARRFYKGGYEPEDFFQEGALGLYNAVMTYSKSGGASFATYASVCIENRLLSAYKHASRKKDTPMDNYLSLNLLDEINRGGCLADSDPEEQVIEKETVLKIGRAFAAICSEKERRVFSLYLKGLSYKKIAAELGIKEKAVDNILQGIKRKLKSAASD